MKDIGAIIKNGATVYDTDLIDVLALSSLLDLAVHWLLLYRLYLVALIVMILGLCIILSIILVLR